MGFMITPGDALGNARDVPGAVATFGEAALTAAAERLPPGTCRWCLSRALSVRHRQPAPAVTEANILLLGRPCPRHRRETLVAAAGDFGKDRYATGTYEAVARGGRLGLGKRVVNGPAGAYDELDPLKHYVIVWPEGGITMQHASACALQPGACHFDSALLVQGGLLELPSIPQADSAREVSTAFDAYGGRAAWHETVWPRAQHEYVRTASANLAARVRGGPPTEVRPLAASARNVAAMRRMGVRPETYFGPGYTTVEEDAKLGAFIRRTYPGRGRRRERGR